MGGQISQAEEIARTASRGRNKCKIGSKTSLAKGDFFGDQCSGR